MFKAVVLDIDGCISSEVGVAFNLLELNKIQDINKKSEENFSFNPFPFITLNSGRPHAYCEAVSQMIGCNQFFIFENGAGISKLNGVHYQYILDDKIEMLLLAKMDDIFKKVLELFGSERISLQPNKIYAKTLLFDPNDPLRLKVHEFITSMIEKEDLNLYSEYGYNFININIKGVDKGTGLDLFRNMTQINFSEMVGIGDSISDKLFMEKCGFKACPSNASKELKIICDYVSPYRDVSGTVDIINKIIELNKKT